MLSSMMFQSTSATPKQPFQSAEADDERSTPWSQRQENLRRQSFMALDAEEEKENTFATEADDIFNQFKNDESSKNRSRVKHKAPTESVAPDTTKRPRVNRPPPLRPRRRSMGVNTRRLSSRIASQNPVTEPSNVGALGRPPLATKDALSDNSKTPRGASARKRNGREGESVKKSTRKQTDTKRKAGRTGDSSERTFCMGTTENVSNIDLNGIGLNPKTPGTARQRRMSMRGVGNKSARSTRKSSKKLRHQVSEKSRLEEAEKLKNKGNQSFAKQQYEKAIKEYSLAIQLDPDNATYLANRAAALLMLERYDLAIDDCEAALQKRPGYFRAQMRASRAYLAVGRTSHSLQHLNRVIQVPKQTDSKVASQAMETAMKEAYEMIEQVKAYDSLIEKADHALRSEDPVLAKECADEASALSPQSKVVGLIRVTAVLIGVATGVTPLPAGANPAVGGKGLLGEAAHELEMMGFKTCHAQDVARYGHILRNCALTSEAKLFLTASLRLDPSVNEVVQSLEFVKKMEQLLCDGINAFHKNNCEIAIALFDQALALDPTNKAYNCRMHYRKGAAHLTMHMYAEAVLDCNRALSLVSTYHKARSQRAKALVALGRYTEAARDLEHVLQHNGGDKQTKVDLEAIRRRIDSSEQQQQSASNSSNSSNRNDIPPFHTASESRTSNPAECRGESFGQNMKRSATHGPTTSSSGRYSFHRSNTTGASSTTHQAAGNKSSHTRPANHAGATNGSKFDSNNERHRYFTRSARKPTAAHSGRRKSPRVALRINDPTASHYELLGITTLASASQIKTAFKKLALKFHPDKNSSPSAEAKFKRISEAYGVLSSPGRRRQYDRTQGMHARRQPVF